MALAAFGTDRFYRVAREGAFELHDDGTLQAAPSTDRGWAHLGRSHGRVLPEPRAGGPLTQDHYDLAWAFQQFAEEILVHLARRSTRAPAGTGSRWPAGWRSTAWPTQKILRETPFRGALRHAQRRRSRAGGRRRPLRLPRRARRQGAPSARPRLPRSRRARSGDRRRARRRRRHRVRKSDDIASECAALVADGTHHRLGAGRRRVRAARARASQHPRRPPHRREQGAARRRDQAARVVPALRPERPRRARRRVLRDARPEPLHASSRSTPGRRYGTRFRPSSTSTAARGCRPSSARSSRSTTA